MLNWQLWLRWSWRDLRSRWVQVLAIAIIIALGAGVFAGLGGQETWRTDSYDESYARLNMHDLEIDLATGSFVDGERLVSELSQVDDVQAVEARLITPTLVDASYGGETIVVQGRMIGVDVSRNGLDVDSITADGGEGRTFTAQDAGEHVVALEYKFARHHDIDPGMTIRVSGDTTLEVVGNVHSPEYFLVMPQPGVASVEPVSEFSETVENLLALAMNILGIVGGVVLLMAFLIAFNSTSINVDERVREIATMLPSVCASAP